MLRFFWRTVWVGNKSVILVGFWVNLSWKLKRLASTYVPLSGGLWEPWYFIRYSPLTTQCWVKDGWASKGTPSSKHPFFDFGECSFILWEILLNIRGKFVLLVFHLSLRLTQSTLVAAVEGGWQSLENQLCCMQNPSWKCVSFFPATCDFFGALDVFSLQRMEARNRAKRKLHLKGSEQKNLGLKCYQVKSWITRLLDLGIFSLTMVLPKPGIQDITVVMRPSYIEAIRSCPSKELGKKKIIHWG